MTPSRSDQTVNIQQAMDLVRVSRRTIYNWMEQGKIEWVRTVGGHVRIVRASLWQQKQGPAAKSV